MLFFPNAAVIGAFCDRYNEEVKEVGRYTCCRTKADPQARYCRKV